MTFVPWAPVIADSPLYPPPHQLPGSRQKCWPVGVWESLQGPAPVLIAYRSHPVLPPRAQGPAQGACFPSPTALGSGLPCFRRSGQKGGECSEKDHQRGGAGAGTGPCLQGPPPTWLSPSLPGGEQREGGRELLGALHRAGGPFLCFIVWAGPSLIPHLPPGLSGAHREEDRGPRTGRRQGGPLHQAVKGRVLGPVRQGVPREGWCSGSVSLDSPLPRGCVWRCVHQLLSPQSPKGVGSHGWGRPPHSWVPPTPES